MVLLKNKIVFITGASSGIGRACAKAFAREGANLILTARRIKLLDELAAELMKTYGNKVYTAQLDIRNFDNVSKIIDSLGSDWKDIDILVNNAGVGRGMNKLYNDNHYYWEEMIDTNIKGLLFVTRKIVPGMVKRNQGHVINIGSIAGHQAYCGGSVYCSTKHAVKAITQSLRLDLLDKNIRVSSIDPGIVETDFFKVRFYGDLDRVKEFFKGIIPLKPDDVAETVVFCATRPSHVNINEIIILPKDQGNAYVIHRREQDESKENSNDVEEMN
jgi:3-hydroxy acid dehydrogenase / malonic semialdehyde reductase